MEGNACPLRDDLHCKGTLKCLKGDNKPINIPKLTDYKNNEFYSLSHKHIYKTSSSRKESCNLTGNTMETKDILGMNVPSPYNKYKYGTCKLSNNRASHNKKSCDLLNKIHKPDGSGEKDTAHWGKYCEQPTTKNLLPQKLICDNLDNKTYQWQQTLIGKVWEGACIKDYNGATPSKMIDKDLCNKVTPGNKWFPKAGGNECIITAETENIGDIKNICTMWGIPGKKFISQNRFKYEQKSDNIIKDKVERYGTCVPGKGRDALASRSLKQINSKDDCEKDNYEWTREYTFSDTSYCKLSDAKNEPDRILTWTGGELKSDNKDNWSDECSSSMLSSCQVKCDPKYGGGGTYTCHYNTHAEDVCKHIQDGFGKIYVADTQKSHCEAYPNCEYSQATPLKDSKCTSLKPKDGTELIKGQAEWLGSRCYKLNNDAFAHDIFNLPTLNEAFPPLMRLISLFIILIIFLYIFKWVGGFKKSVTISFSITKWLSSSLLKGIIAFIRDVVLGIYLFGQSVVVTIADPNVYKDVFKKIEKVITNWRSYIVYIVYIALLAGSLFLAYSLDKLNFIITGYKDSEVDDEIEGAIPKLQEWVKDESSNLVNDKKETNIEVPWKALGIFIGMLLVLYFVGKRFM